MRWHDTAAGGVVDEWNDAVRLELTDPYLVWLDLTGYRGAALPGGRSSVLPVLRERRDGSFRTQAVRPGTPPGDVASVQTLAEPARRGTTQRFEVAAGFASADEAPGQGMRPPHWPQESRGHLDGPADGRRALEPRPVIGFIDYGCAFAHRKFMENHQGRPRTRVLAIWDQTQAERRAPVDPGIPGLQALQWGFPRDFPYGAETHRDRSWRHAGALQLQDFIDQFWRDGALDEERLYGHAGYPALTGVRATHGTHVMDLATGHPRPTLGVEAAASGSAAPHDADIVFVQLPRRVAERQVSGLLRANVYDAVRYILDCAHPGQPVVVNLSYGGNAGPHDGSSVLESALDSLIGRERAAGRSMHLVLPAGNARLRRMHASGQARDGAPAVFHWNNLPDDPSDSFVEVWLPDGDASICVTPPGGGRSAVLTAGQAGCWRQQEQVLGALIYPTRACQSGRGRMALLAVTRTRTQPDAAVAPYGRWIIEVVVHSPAPVAVDVWCERDDPPFGTLGPPRQGYFSDTTTSAVATDGTLNSIAHGRHSWVVGGRMGRAGTAPYSGTGPGRGLDATSRTRNADHNPVRGPNVLEASDESPAVPGLLAAAVYGTDKVRLSGTSLAAALATRAIVENGFAAPALAPAARGASRPRPATLDRHPDDDLAR